MHSTTFGHNSFLWTILVLNPSFMVPFILSIPLGLSPSTWSHNFHLLLLHRIPSGSFACLLLGHAFPFNLINVIQVNFMHVHCLVFGSWILGQLMPLPIYGPVGFIQDLPRVIISWSIHGSLFVLFHFKSCSISCMFKFIHFKNQDQFK